MSQIKVKLGEYDFNVQGESGDRLFGLQWWKMHENYDSKTFENDIAILRLNNPVQESTSIKPICLPDAGKTFENTRADAVGKYLYKQKDN